MSEEVKTPSAGAGPNAEAEKDVQNILAELKAEENKSEEKADSEEKESATNGASVDEAAEEARIVAEAAKLGQESEKKEESKTDSKDQRRGTRAPRGRANHRENVKTDFTSQEESSDPEAIRKQVSLIACSIDSETDF
jgi:lupus La protein